VARGDTRTSYSTAASASGCDAREKLFEGDPLPSLGFLLGGLELGFELGRHDELAVLVEYGVGPRRQVALIHGDDHGRTLGRQRPRDDDLPVLHRASELHDLQLIMHPHPDTSSLASTAAASIRFP